jgi:hypothetical protein
MMEREETVMRRHVETLLSIPGLCALNVGHRMGIVDTAIQVHAHPNTISLKHTNHLNSISFKHIPKSWRNCEKIVGLISRTLRYTPEVAKMRYRS